MLRSTFVSLAVLLAVASAVPEALAQSTETTTAEQPRSRSRSRATSTTARQPSPGQLAARQRMRDCGAEWRGVRGTPQAQNRTWREFSRECLSRHRGGDNQTTTTRRSRTRSTGSF